jgi:xanthine/CO dehydrogenase XdhC/CoxF family maturation factor
MSVNFRALLSLFRRERSAGRPMVLATVTRTEGPTYTKAGAMMLIAASGEYAGLLSGGCLEGDLAEHGRGVLESARPKMVRYDMHGPDDLLFGLGSGCEGAMDILLMRLDAASGWEPVTRLVQAWEARLPEEWWLVVRSQDPAWPVGSGVFPSDGVTFGAVRQPAGLLTGHGGALGIADADVLRLQLLPPPRVLLLGAGPDAPPVARMAEFLGWQLTVIDHRPRYATNERFPSAELVLGGGPEALSELLSQPHRAATIAAAIVMSHHFVSDQNYLAALAASEIPYVGLLGPIVRRERLLSQLGALAARLRGRLCSPVGLDLGADTPEGIALAIAAEIQARLAGRSALEPLSQQREIRAHAPAPALTDPISP